MDNVLITFLKSSTSVVQEDLDFIQDYRLANVVCVAYNYTSDMLDELEGRLESMGKRVQFIIPDGYTDADLDRSIRTVVIATADIIYIDVTHASPFHAASVMNMGGSEKVEIWYSSYAQDGTVKRRRMDRTKYIYNGLSKTCYLILDLMTKEPIKAERALEEINRIAEDKGTEQRKKTSVYNAFDAMAAWGLIQRCEGTVPEDYKSRTPNFFRLSDDQMWDYFSYRRLQKKRDAELMEAKHKKSAAKQSKSETKTIGAARRRTNPRKKRSGIADRCFTEFVGKAPACTA